MKVCIHLQPAADTLGGAEGLAANIALLLKDRHQVEVVHHRSWLTIERLADFSGTSLDGVTGRYIERHPNYFLSRTASPIGMIRDTRRWGRELVGDADAVISLTHDLPPVNPARHGVLFLLFPLTSALDTWPLAPGNGSESIKTRLGRSLHTHRYRGLWSGYNTRLAISEFSARWGRIRWGIDCDVVAPIVDCSTIEASKDDLILSVGRFAVEGVSKAQREMAVAFMKAVDLAGWRLRCVGSALTPAEVAYAADVAAHGPQVAVETNVPRDVVRSAFAHARIFWHAAGLTSDENTQPELLEHFGIVTVEAMANGCVPVVIGRGGQREIVEHGRNGFLCDSLEEMVRRTIELARDRALWLQMSTDARRRAAAFDADAFARHFHARVPFLR